MFFLGNGTAYERETEFVTRPSSAIDNYSTSLSYLVCIYISWLFTPWRVQPYFMPGPHASARRTGRQLHSSAPTPWSCTSWRRNNNVGSLESYDLLGSTYCRFHCHLAQTTMHSVVPEGSYSWNRTIVLSRLLSFNRNSSGRTRVKDNF